MKIAAFLFFVLIGFSTMAQPKAKEVKVAVYTKGVRPVSFEEGMEIKVARVYLNKSYRVKRELWFMTKRNRAKVA